MNTFTKSVRILGTTAVVAVLLMCTLASFAATEVVAAPAIAAPSHSLSQTEAAKWIGTECATTAKWDDAKIPTTAIVRDDITAVVSRMSFDKAYAASKSGSVWVLGFCA